MFTAGRTPGSSSSVATRRMTCGCPTHSAIRCVPQREQKCRSLPGDDSNEASAVSPCNQRKSARSTRAVEANAAACAFRQVRQWQWPIAVASCVTS